VRPFLFVFENLARLRIDSDFKTIRALKELDVDYIIPLHCSGEVFYEIAKGELPNKLLRSYTGTRFVFDGAGA
jgi:7,8-dihydropterin-6-yl-methyl-4-(beta-D-ribofuranosyl)aminobenzene 5'-phosphate synthase